MMKVYIAAPVKMEELYIREWLSHYKKIGVDKVILGDNNDVDYEPDLTSVIEDFISEGFVEVLDERGNIGIQEDFNNRVYREYGKQCDYIGLIDADEFIELPGFDNIKDFLVTVPHESVALRWYNYGDNNELSYRDAPVKERFTEMSPKQLEGLQPTKFLLKTNKDLKISNFYSPSSDYCDALNSKNFRVLIKSPKTFCMMWHNPEYLKTAYIAHYPTKSMEEYVKQKVTRGRVDKCTAPRYTDKYYCMYNYMDDHKRELLKKMIRSVLRR